MIPPELDPETFREQGRSLIDHLADYLHRALRGELPVLPWRPPAELSAAWETPFSQAPDRDPRALESLFARVVAEANHLHHPRYVGHQVTAPLPAAALADLVSARLNNSMAVYEMGPGATAIERAVIRFLASRRASAPATAPTACSPTVARLAISLRCSPRARPKPASTRGPKAAPGARRSRCSARRRLTIASRAPRRSWAGAKGASSPSPSTIGSGSAPRRSTRPSRAPSDADLDALVYRPREAAQIG